MAIEVKLIDVTPIEAMDIVRELRKNGYAQGIDFDFAYHKPKYDDFSYEPVYNRYTEFTFYKEELATWFALRYQ
jgi:hypothetical protein